MQINKLVYGSWVVLLLCAVVIAAFNMKASNAIGQSEPTTALGEPSEAVSEPEPDPTAPVKAELQTVAFQDEAPGTLPVVAGNDPLAETKLKALRRIVSEEWPDATEEQIRIWSEDFQDVPEEGFRLMLRQKRATLGSMPSLFKPRELPQPPIIEAASSENHTLLAIRAAREAVIANIMNRYSIGHRAKIVEFASYNDGVQIAETRYATTRGITRATGNPLDVATSGGLFVVADGDKQFFTRAGRFSINDDRRLSLEVGDRELTVSGAEPIPADAGSIRVSPEGDVSSETAAGVVELGRIQVVQFLDSSRLKSVGGCLFEETSKSGAPTKATNIVISQGTVELSNASPDECDALLEQLQEWEALATGN